MTTALDVVRIEPDGTITILVADPAPVFLWDRLRRAYVAAGRPSVTADGESVPLLTVGDVRRLVVLWNDLLARSFWFTPGVAWRAWLRDAPTWLAEVRAMPASATYLASGEFWRVTAALAADIADMPKGIMSESEAMFERVKRGATTFLGVTTGAAFLPAIGDTAVKVGRGVGQAVGGVWRAIGTPLLIGAGLVGAAVIVPRLLPPGRGDR